MANILLIYPEPEEIKDCRFGFSLRLLYLSSILKQAGHKVRLMDFSMEEYKTEKFISALPSTDVVIIEFDSFPLKRTININSGENLIKVIKENKREIKIIAFGYDCALFLRKIEHADYTFTTEPEKAINQLIELLLMEKNFLINELKMEIYENLDVLPFPDRAILLPYVEYGGTITKKPNLAKSTLLETSRGCLNSCSFCHRKGWLSKYREHSIDYVAEEFRTIHDNKYSNVWITDDNFTFNLTRAKNLLHGLISSKVTDGMKIALSSWINIDREFLELAKEANISLISFGIESTSQEILKIYKKDIDLNKTEELIRFADNLGIYTVGNFIIGAPMETVQTIDDTFKYTMKVPFDQINIKILNYMAGSELYNNLPQEMTKQQRHIFACKETGLNDFPLNYLKNRINQQYQRFSENRRVHFLIKAAKYGLPYKIREK